MEKIIDNSKKKPIYRVLIVLGFISLISIFWFRGNYAIGGGDHYKSIDYYRYLKTLNSPWFSRENTGSPNYSLEFHLPFSLLYLPLGFIGFGPIFTQKIWFYLSLFLPGYFMYLFLDELYGKKVTWLFKLSVVLLYLFNPVMMLYPVAQVLTKYPVYLSLPLLCYLLLKIFNVKGQNNKIYYAFLLSVSTLLLPASVKNIAELSPVVILLLALLIYNVSISKKSYKDLIYIGGAFILSLLFNFWWIYSSFYSQFISAESFTQIVEEYDGMSSKIFDAIRLMGFWGLRAGFKGVPYFEYGEYFYTPFAVFITLLIPSLVFLPLLLSSPLLIKDQKKENNFYKYLIFVFVSFFAIFLIKGVNPPSGFWYQNLLDKYPLFRMFREPYSKFSYLLLFSYSTAIVYSLHRLSSLLKKKFEYVEQFILGSFLLLVVLISYPMFTGDILPDMSSGQRKQMLVKVPDYWYDLENYSKNNDIAGRVLTIPRNDYYKKSYIWEKGYVGRPYELFLDANYVFFKSTGAQNSGDRIIREVYDSIQYYNETKDPKYIRTFLNLSKLLNITHILQMNDFDVRNHYEDASWYVPSMYAFYGDIKDYLSDSQKFGMFDEEYLMSIPHVSGGPTVTRMENDATTQDYQSDLLGKPALELFSLNDSFMQSEVYIPEVLYEVKQKSDVSELLVSEELYNQDFGVFVSDDSLFYEVGTAVLSNEKINDAKYKIYITDVTGSEIPLIFYESFDSGWRLARKCNFLFCTSFIKAKHLEANLYANSWIINSNEISGNDSFYIVHDSLSRLRLGLIISLASLLFSTMFVFIMKKRNKKNV